MLYLGVDLASRSSAFVGVGDEGEVIVMGDSYGKTETDFVHELIATAAEYRLVYGSFVLAVEDLPHHIPYRISVKEVCRIQGRIAHHANYYGMLSQLVFVPPATWQRSYDGVFRQGAKGARAAAEELGYTPPDLVADERFDIMSYSGKERTKRRNAAKKMMTDYDDAFLIARWARNEYLETDVSFPIPTVQFYHAD